MDISNISEGYYNLLKKKLKISKKDIEDMAEYRLDKCNRCEENNRGKCMLCGCTLEAKVRSSKSKCPIGEW